MQRAPIFFTKYHRTYAKYTRPVSLPVASAARPRPSAYDQKDVAAFVAQSVRWTSVFSGSHPMWIIRRSMRTDKSRVTGCMCSYRYEHTSKYICEYHAGTQGMRCDRTVVLTVVFQEIDNRPVDAQADSDTRKIKHNIIVVSSILDGISHTYISYSYVASIYRLLTVQSTSTICLSSMCSCEIRHQGTCTSAVDYFFFVLLRTNASRYQRDAHMKYSRAYIKF